MDLRYRIGKSYRGLFDGSIADPFILVEGRRGTAKTASILKAFAVRAFRWPGSRYLIARSTRTRLSDSVIHTFDNHVLPSFGLPPPLADASHRTGYDFPLINGKRSRFIFMALDDPGRSQSVEADGAYISEATELPTQEQATALTAAIRPRLEASQEGVEATDPFPGLIRQVVLDCNPSAPGHWLNVAAEPAGVELRMIANEADYERTVAFNLAPSSGGWKRIITSLADNPGYWDKTAWAPTDACQRYLDGLGYMAPHQRVRWLQGLWCQAEGAVFPEFREEIHVVDNFDPPADWPWYVGWDPGFAHPTGIPWVCVSPLGDLYVGDEVYEGGKSIAQHAETCLKKCSGRTVARWFGDPHEFFSRRAQGESCAAQAKKAGLPTFMPWAAQEKQAMVNAYRQLLQNSVTLAQTGRRVGVCLYVMKRCTNTIMEHQSWAFKRNAKGELTPGDDAYEDANNHLVGDPLVGMVATGMLKYGIREKAVAAENSFD